MLDSTTPLSEFRSVWSELSTSRLFFADIRLWPALCQNLRRYRIRQRKDLLIPEYQLDHRSDRPGYLRCLL